jgi:hypothetical protein
MTQQYLVGELSVLLGLLQETAPDAAAVREIARLRDEAETRTPAGLASVMARALALADRLCWESLSRTDAAAFARQAEAAAFARQAEAAAALHEFGVCAGLIE